jgi:hypothetical protein
MFSDDSTNFAPKLILGRLYFPRNWKRNFRKQVGINKSIICLGGGDRSGNEMEGNMIFEIFGKS